MCYRKDFDVPFKGMIEGTILSTVREVFRRDSKVFYHEPRAKLNGVVGFLSVDDFSP